MTPSKDINILLKNARFDLTEEEKELFKKDFEVYLDMIKVFKEFDLSNVKEARAPFEYLESDDTLRDDSVVFNNSIRVLEQASKTEDGYIVLEEDKNE
jgi:aspartyl/glutamyl-tRNA(Asn/Gln) amidotransferase C subunit